MKRELKKLTLCRETLCLLTDLQMAAAAGGHGSGDSCPVCPAPTDPCTTVCA